MVQGGRKYHTKQPVGWKSNNTLPDTKVHGVNMEPIWGRQDPGGPHVGPMNFTIWAVSSIFLLFSF